MDSSEMVTQVSSSGSRCRKVERAAGPVGVRGLLAASVGSGAAAGAAEQRLHGRGGPF